LRIGVVRLQTLLPLMTGLHDLFEPERDQHAEHDDPDLAREFAPAVQRLGKMEMHAAGAPQATVGSLTEGLTSAMAAMGYAAAAALANSASSRLNLAGSSRNGACPVPAKADIWQPGHVC